MKGFVKYLLVFSCLWNEHSFAVGETQWDGDFTIKEFGEQLNDGSQVYLRYNLNIDSKKNHASLSMTTWHAILKCTGDYSLKIKPDILELHHSDSENLDCPYPSPQFEITRKGKNYYIKGSVFSYSLPGKWLPLQKVIQK
ncbi:hypothetical protein [Escherichia coli]|uniref:hypothetical protein n=1 Tax=Escherichia coli TaxID=562 RepID=UPI0021BED532|nr:hypothetical protein [Escherichia coli]MCT8918761.1 hypothetical protein [Escherichia coli]HAW0505547.1 hypothetical protein [Escherichia coli]HAW4280148.1 hypothetical protein [Escherichia coli]HAW4293758.1 hypothetical protein [Escherichia coli]HBB9640800.1 hypothetical protein [Escherichia coli]